MIAHLETGWHPIATSLDLPYRHVYQAKLLGRELAVWRADDDFVNVWENRCLHRGVRLSIGINDGRELKCQYHGWRYANRTAGCTYIPAHPADAPARTICNRTFPAVERYGLIWSGEDPQGEIPSLGLVDGDAFALRSLSVNAPSDLVLEHLSDLDWAVFFVQPVDSNQSVIRPVSEGAPPKKEQLAVLRRHNTELSRLRDAIEVDASTRPTPEPMVATIEQVAFTQVDMPSTPSGRTAPLRVRVARKWEAAEGVAGFELESMGDPLPTQQPGAHIDVHLPNGLVRQYSITNGPGDGTNYRIGVKLEPDSRGGSSCLHEAVREDDVLAISEPRNNFPLRRDSVRTLLIAGGIGITPLLAMAQALENDGLDYELHYFAHSEDHLAFGHVLDQLGPSFVPHLGLSPTETGEELGRLLATYEPASHVYVCGPGPMLETTRATATEAGWPDHAVHFEYFKNTNEIDDSSSFEVSLARSALTLTVPGGKTILEVLRQNGVPMPSSCEQGACGTCEIAVLDGEPDHQDVYLNDSEKQAGDRIITCVSRARSDQLVLDV